MSKIKYPCTLQEAEARFQELAEERGKKNVQLISIPLDDEETEHACAILRKPTRKELDLISQRMSTGIFTATEVWLKTCWLEGDKRVIDEDEVFYSATTSINDVISFRVSTLKKSIEETQI